MIDLAHALPYLSPVQSADETAPLHSWGSIDAPITRSFSATLNVTYTMDEPAARTGQLPRSGPAGASSRRAIVFIRLRDVDRPKRDELHARATENLRTYASQRRLHFEPQGATHVARLDGEHEASLLLLDELWDAPNRVPVDGELYAIVPTHGSLVVASSARGGLAELRAMLTRATHRLLSSEILVRRNRAWTTFERHGSSADIELGP